MDDMTVDVPRTPAFLAGGGEMGARIRSLDWSATPLGPPERWPQSLRTSVSILLYSRYPMFLGWGPQLTMFYNDAYRPILGATKHPAALGRPTREVWAEIWDTLGPLADRAVQQGEATWSDDLVLFMNRYDYVEETYFTFSYSPIRDESGGVGGMFCACTETTGKVLGERRLRTLRDLTAAAAEARTVDEACRRCMGVLESNAADLPFAVLYMIEGGRHARFAGAANARAGDPVAPAAFGLADEAAAWPLRRVIAGQSEFVSDLPARFASVPASAWGEPTAAALVLPVAGRGQERPGAALVLGVNPRRALDDDYRDFLDLVTGNVAAVIANARSFEEERKRAEALAELDRAKTVFFSNVSHEFRTPLTLLLGPLEDVLARADGGAENALPAAVREAITVAHRNGLRLLKLVNTLLDFSRVEAGRVQAVYEPTDLAALTADLASTFRSAIERAGMRLIVDCPPLPAPVHVDRDMWEKIVLNLVSNAFKFTLDGEIAVAVRAGDGVAELTVRDTGAGIPREELPRLFDRFHRIVGTRGRTHEGTGIGLALVQELVKLHGGTVRVESALGQGSAFIVAIPFGTAHLPAERIGAQRALASTAFGAAPYVEEALRWLPDGGPAQVEEAALTKGLAYCPLPPQIARQGGPQARILLADDNADMRDYVRGLLGTGCAVEAVPDGEAALAAIQARPPDLVLSDVMMPRLDGFGLLRALREDPRTRDLPIILLSARAGEEASVEGLDAGADDYLIKPFSARELVARVGAHLQLARLRRSAMAALQASERQLALAVQATRLGLWDLDPRTMTLDSTPQARAILGLPADRPATFGTCLAALHPDDRDRAQRAVQRALEPARGGAYAQDYRVVWPDGAVRWVAATGRALFEGDGPDRQAVRFIGTLLDITERKQAEAALSAALAEKETLLEQKDTLMREVNHRVKNSLQLVSSLLQLQGRSAKHPAIQEQFAEAQHRVLTIAKLHQQLYQQTGTPDRIEFARYLRELCTDLVSTAFSSRTQVRVAVAADPGEMLTDQAVPLALIANELVTNAFKYAFRTTNGGGTIGVTFRAEADGQRSLVVADDGCGLPDGFDPAKGNGLGMRLVRALVMQLGGRLDIEPADPGTRFTVTFSLSPGTGP